MIQINEMSIRIPGNSVEEGRSIGERIANQIGKTLPDDTKNRNIDDISVRILVTPGMSNEMIADQIARELLIRLSQL